MASKNQSATRVSADTRKPGWKTEPPPADMPVPVIGPPVASQGNLKIDAAPRAELTPHQRLLADIAIAGICTGGHGNDDLLGQITYVLVKCAYAGQFARHMPLTWNKEYLASRSQEWKRELIRDAVDAPTVTTLEPDESMSPGKYFNARARWRLADDLTDWLAEASPDEVHFLQMAMQIRDSEHHGHDLTECAIAHAASSVLPGVERHYLAVPAHHLKAVDELMALLERTEAAAAAKG